MSKSKLPWSKSEDDLLLQVAIRNMGSLPQQVAEFQKHNYQERSFEAIRCRLRKIPSLERRNTPWSKSEDELLLQVATLNIGTLPQLAVKYKEQSCQKRSSQAIQCRLRILPALVQARAKRKREGRPAELKTTRMKHKGQPKQPEQQHQQSLVQQSLVILNHETDIIIPTHPLIIKCQLRDGAPMCSCGKLSILHKESSELALADE